MSRTHYALPHHKEEAIRLGSQHELLAAIFKGRRAILDERIPLEKSHNVLDVGCGSGVWLQDLLEKGEFGRKLPSDAQGWGWDINLDKLNDQVKSDSRLHFELRNILDPPSCEERFDIVGLRLLVLGMNLEEYRLALQHCFKVLKSGGWIQVIESDRFREDIPDDAIYTLTKKVADTFVPSMHMLYNNLPAVFREAGFADVRVEDVKSPFGRETAKQLGYSEEFGVAAAHNVNEAVANMKGAYLASGRLVPGVETSEQLSEFSTKRNAWTIEHGYVAHWRIITGRKP